MKSYNLFIQGDPKAQPRPRACRFGNSARVYNPGTTDKWKAAIIAEVKRYIAAQGPLVGPVCARLHFRMPRPKAHFRSGKNSALIRDCAPSFHDQKPDLDNLAKPVMDALTVAGAWSDDCGVVDMRVSKQWATDSLIGCEVTITEVQP